MASFEKLVDRIYQATTEPDTWPAVLHHIGQSINAPAGLLLMWRTDHWVGWQISPETPPGFDKYVSSDAPTRSITTPRLIAANHAGFLSSAEGFEEDEYLNDPYTTEWSGPAGLHHCAATAIQIPNGDFAVIQFSRFKDKPPMDQNDLARLDFFRPHLARAALLAARWKMERLRAATEALALVGLPAAVLDFKGCVINTNKLIEEMTAGLVWLPGNKVALADPSANLLLHKAIAALGSSDSTSVRSIPLRIKTTNDAMVVHLIPAYGRTRDLFDGGFGILIITPVSTRATPDTALLQSLFDLTPCEARLASGIAAGLSLKQLAERYSITISTARTQTKAVLAKTGTSRQVQVASLLAGVSKFQESEPG